MNLMSEIKRQWKTFAWRHLTVNRDNWKTYTKFVPFSHKMMQQLSHPKYGGLIRRWGGFEGKESYSQSYVVPINRDVNYKGQGSGTVLPMNMLHQLIEDSSYRIIMNQCLCRDGMACKDYPQDLGCIMLGEACRAQVGRGVARYATVEDAKAHADRAAEMGLVALCAWVEFEAAAMGIPQKEHEKYMEICLCCPCCCLGLKNMKQIVKSPEMKERIASIGWRAQGTEDCVSCEVCVNICPAGAIELNGDTISVNDDCIGCGICAVKCPQEAINMQQIAPMKDHILDYFKGLRPVING